MAEVQTIDIRLVTSQHLLFHLVTHPPDFKKPVASGSSGKRSDDRSTTANDVAVRWDSVRNRVLDENRDSCQFF